MEAFRQLLQREKPLPAIVVIKENITGNRKSKFMFLILISIFSVQSCNTSPTEEEIKKYKNKSEQLVGQWISEFSKNVSIICVMQNDPIDSLPYEKRNMIIQKLKLKGEEHLNKQFELTHYFRLTDSLVGGLNLISLDTQRELKEQRNNGEPFWRWYEENCEGEWLNISRPIFNEIYTLAYFEVSTSCGYLCGYGGKSIYKYEDGKWLPIDIFDTFIN